MPDFGPPPSPQDLQFQHAEPIAEATSSEGSAQNCVVCKQPAGGTYFQAQGQVVCPLCAERIQAVQQAAPALSLMRAALYGGAAALGGCALYALVAIVLHAEIGIIAILVGWMVGKAIRHASYGRGGRPPKIDRKSTRLNSTHTEIYTLSLHDVLPIYRAPRRNRNHRDPGGMDGGQGHPPRFLRTRRAPATDTGGGADLLRHHYQLHPGDRLPSR